MQNSTPKTNPSNKITLLKSPACWLLLCFSLLTNTLCAQDVLWKANFTGAGNNAPFKSVIDNQNNIYVLGTFDNTCDGIVPLHTKGGSDIFIAKYDSNSNLLWTRQLGSTTTYDFGTGFAVSPDGEYIYVTGVFMSTLFADNLSINSTGSIDGFLAKYRNNGDLIWLKNIASGTGATLQRPNEIKIDINNRLVIGGLFYSEIKLGDSNINFSFSTAQAQGMFISQFDTSGVILNAKKFESSNSNPALYTLDVDATGYYLGGFYKGSLITDLETKNSNNGSVDAYVYKVDFNLSGQWLIQVSGTGDEQLYSCSVDNLGYLYIGGFFKSPSLFVDSTSSGIASKRTILNTTTDGKSDVFFAKYSSSGILQWFNTAGSTGTDYLFRAFYKNDKFIAAGQYEGTLTFNNQAITSKGGSDAFAIVRNSSNTSGCLLSVGGTGADVGETALVDNQGNYIFIGDYTSPRIYFGNKTDSLDNSHPGTKDMFVAKYERAKLTKTITPVSCKGGSNGAVDITPVGVLNPPLQYTWRKTGDASFNANTEDISGLSAGTYRVTLTDSLGYSKTDSVTLTDPQPITLTAVIANVACINGTNNGKITLNTPVNGKAPFTYQWGNGSKTSEISPLKVGAYMVTVTDSLGCQVMDTFHVVYDAPMVSHLVIANVDSSEHATGGINPGITGGHLPLAYNWSNGDTAAILIGIPIGKYSVTVTDSKQCSVTLYATVTEPSPAIYMGSEQAPDPENYTPDTSLPVEPVAGGAGVSPTGAAAYTVPVEVPPGIAGMVPKIALSYSSQTGNGIVGWGWNISGLSVITRTSKNIYSDGQAKGLQLSKDDPYVWDGNRLVVTSGTNGADNSEYATENETFSKIVAHGNHGDTGPEWFEVTAKNGTRYKYGSNRSSQTVYSYKDINTTNAVLAWYLDTVEDAYGNFISYQYEWGNFCSYVKKISYGNNKYNNTHQSNTVEFYYAQRNDPIPVHVGQLIDKMDQVLYKIVVKNNDAVYRRYQFDFTSDIYTRLVKITESTGNGEQKLNPTIIKWGNYNTGPVVNDSIVVSPSAYKGFGDQYYTSADVNGDGLDDLVGFFPYDYSCGPGCTSNTTAIQVYTASKAADGSCHFTPDGIPYDLGPNINLDYKTYITGNTSGDIDGDGKREIITARYSYMDYIGAQVHFDILKNGGHHPIDRDLKASTEMPVYAIGDLNNDGIDEIVFIEKGTNDKLNYPGQLALFGKSKWIPFNIHQQPSIPVNVPLVGTVYIPIKPERLIIADFDGDGMQDIIVFDKKGYMIYKNNGIGDSISFKLEKTGTSFSSDYALQMGDFNGDGLPDFVLSKKGTDTGEWYLALNDGKMGFNMVSLPGITARDDKDTEYDNDKDNIIVTDFNKDGKSDVIIVDATYDNWEHDITGSWKSFTGLHTYWYKSTGNALELVKTASSGNEGDAYNQFFITGDFNGDGRADLVNYGYDCFGSTGMDTRWRLYDLPDTSNTDGLITTIANGLNVKTRFGYKSLTDKSIYTSSGASVYPMATITAPLYVVSELKTDNGVAGKAKVSYSYEDATIHKQGRGFLGFGKVKQTDSVSQSSSSAKTEFNTSYFTVAKQTTETFMGSTKIAEAVSEFATDTLGGRRIFVHPISSISTDLLKNIVVSTVDTFDTQGNLTKQTTAYNSDFYVTEKAFSSYDSKGNPGSITTKMTRKGEPVFTASQSLNYNAQGKPASTMVDNLTTSYTYNIYGNPVTVTLSAPGMDDRKDSSAYDPTSRFVEKQFNALGFLSANTYNNIGNLLSQKDMNGLEITNQYDAWGKLVEITSADKKKSTVTGKWVTIGDPVAPDSALYYTESYSDGKFVGAEYFDKVGHSLRKVSTGFNDAKYYTDYTYNAKSQVTEVTEPYPAGDIALKKTNYTYDDFGRKLTETLSDGVTKTYTYTDSENKVETAYSTGERYTKTYDATGLVSLSTDPGGDITYHYTSTGKTSRIESPGSTVQITYDASDRQHTLTDPNAGTITYRYNAFGELASQRDGRGKADTLAYDKLGRVTAKTTEGVTTTYTYDAPGALGLVQSISSPGKAGTAYTYDGLGRVTGETRSKGNESLTYKYTYDSIGRVSKLTYPAGFAVKYTYNDHNDLTQIRDTIGNLIWKIDTVNAKGQLTNATYGNQKQVAYGYDGNDRLNRISVPGIIDFNYQFNNKQQLDYRDERYWVNDSLKGFREDFTYDKVNRLLTASAADTLVMAYKSSVNDRISSKSDIGSYTYQDGNHRVDEIDSLKGYLPADHYLAFTPEGKIDSISEDKKLLTFVYGIDNQRFSALYSDSATSYTRYYFDTYEKELNSDGGLRHHLNYIFAGNTLVAIYEQKPTGDSMHYVYTDYLGSLRCITDANGNVEQRLGFDAWGNRRDPLTGIKLPPIGGAEGGLLTSRGFTFHEHLDEFGLINMNGRVYDPALGMFLSPDNYVQMPDFTQNFNRYAYGMNNPLMYTDPDGNNPLIIAALIIGGITGTLNVIAHWDQIDNFWDGAAAFGIGFGAGFIGTVSFGTAVGAGGFIGYATAGLASYSTSTSFQSIGNTVYFGDPLPTAEQFATGAVISSISSGVLGGLNSISNGNNFWTGDPIVSGRSSFSFRNRPNPMKEIELNKLTPIQSNVAPQINTEGMRATPLSMNNPEEGIYVLNNTKNQVLLQANGEGITYVRADNFRQGLIDASGYDPGGLARAHHIFPQKFASEFSKAGVNANRYGAWWETVSHGKLASDYNNAWSLFFKMNANPTKLQIYNEAIRLKGIFGF